MTTLITRPQNIYHKLLFVCVFCFSINVHAITANSSFFCFNSMNVLGCTTIYVSGQDLSLIIIEKTSETTDGTVDFLEITSMKLMQAKQECATKIYSLDYVLVKTSSAESIKIEKSNLRSYYFVSDNVEIGKGEIEGSINNSSVMVDELWATNNHVSLSISFCLGVDEYIKELKNNHFKLSKTC